MDNNLLGKNSELVQKIKELKKHNKAKHFIIEELFILGLLQKYNKKIDILLYSEEDVYSDEAKEILHYLKQNCHNIGKISHKTYESLSSKENASGIMALYKDENKDLDILNSKPSFVLVLDQIELPGNLGTIIRTADACNIDMIILVDPVTKIENSKSIASSRGMFLKIPTLTMSYEDAQRYLLENNYRIFLGEPILGKPHYETNYDGNIALVVGNERYGINPNWYENKNEKVFIPMWGEMTSLNVGVAASILMYEAKIKRNK